STSSNLAEVLTLHSPMPPHVCDASLSSMSSTSSRNTESCVPTNSARSVYQTPVVTTSSDEAPMLLKLPPTRRRTPTRPSLRTPSRYRLSSSWRRRHRPARNDVLVPLKASTLTRTSTTTSVQPVAPALAIRSALSVLLWAYTLEPSLTRLQLPPAFVCQPSVPLSKSSLSSTAPPHG